MKVVEDRNVMRYLEVRGLIAQYKKAKEFIIRGFFRTVQLKKRKPIPRNVWSFRITKKYRAFCKRDGDLLVVYEIDDHQ